MEDVPGGGVVVAVITKPLWSNVHCESRDKTVVTKYSNTY